MATSLLMSEPRRPGHVRLSTQLVRWYSGFFILVLGVFGLAIENSVSSRVSALEVSALESEARLIATGIESVSDLPALVDRFSAGTDSRITVISRDGAVLADSIEDESALDNHGDRPEIAEALSGGVGVDRRVSSSIGDSRLYVAVPSESGLVVRVSKTERQLDETMAEIRRRLVWLALAAGVLGLLGLIAMSRRLTRSLAEVISLSEGVSSGKAGLRPKRSAVFEVDQLGLAVGKLAADMSHLRSESQEADNSLREILEGVPEGLVLIGPDDEIVYTNQIASHLLGRGQASRLLGIAPYPLQEIVRQARSEKESRRCDLAPTGSRPPIHAVAVPLDAEGDRILLWVADVTEQFRTDSARRGFVADASHELKTPVASILASAEAARMASEKDPSRVEGFLRAVEEGAERLSRIVADLLDLSRLESADLSQESVDLVRIVEEEVAVCREVASEKEIDMEVSVVPAEVRGDPSELRLLVRNLCENALRFTDRGGKVRVELETKGNRAVLRVSDTGIGIPSRDLGRVFERFYRVDEARNREKGGTGLGLAIVKHVAERHRGSVSVSSELGVGSVFSVDLPLLSGVAASGSD